MYTHGHHESVLRSHRWRTAENSAAYLLSDLKPGLSLLDVGCGPGSMTADFAQRLNPGRVCGIDSSSDVIGAALPPERLLTLAELVAGAKIPPDRPRLFKSTGMSWEDAVVASALTSR